MKVSELMTADVRTCSVRDSINRAAQLMWEADVGCVPVVDGTRVAGMITDRDVCMATYTKGRPPAAIPVASVMTRDVVSCKPGDTITDAANLMRTHRIRRLPVIDAAGALAGILSLNDLARLAASAAGQPARRLRDDELVQTLAAICAPRRAAALVGAPPPPAKAAGHVIIASS
jgi:CBS domain-containing protein